MNSSPCPTEDHTPAKRSARAHGLLVPLAVVVMAALAVNGALYVSMGFRLGGDSVRYLTGAEQIARGEPLSDRQQAYAGYAILLAVVQGAGLPVSAVYGVQVVTSTLAAVVALLAGRKLWGDGAGLTCGLMWACFLDLQRWNFYILSDATFLSSVMVACGLIVLALDAGVPMLVLAALASVLMASLRFNGVAFAVCALVYLLAISRGFWRRLIVAAALLAILALPTSLNPRTWTQARQDLASYATMGFMTEGQVVWETVKIPMPPQTTFTGGVPGDVASYIASHPADVLKLYVLRIGYYLIAYNPSYSRGHIAASTAEWLTLYAAAAVGLWLVTASRPREAGLALIWVCQSLIVAMTTGDYDGRFTLYGAPWLFPFAAVGASETAKQVGLRLAWPGSR